MNVYTYTEARQNLATLLDKALRDSKVRIKRQDGRVFVVKLKIQPSSRVHFKMGDGQYRPSYRKSAVLRSAHFEIHLGSLGQGGPDLSRRFRPKLQLCGIYVDRRLPFTPKVECTPTFGDCRGQPGCHGF